MSLPVLLLLSFLTVQCSGCDLDWETVKNLKLTIEANPTRFRQAFPINYHVVHHYKGSMLCDGDPCCVFPAALVLYESWKVVIGNIWHEHVNHNLIDEIIRSLNAILSKSRHAERLLGEYEEMQNALQNVSSTPEQLLNLTSALFSSWVKVGCSASIKTCVPPTMALDFAKRVELTPLRARLLTTRAVSLEGTLEKMLDIAQQPSNSSPLLSQTLAFFLGPLLFGLLWGLLP